MLAQVPVYKYWPVRVAEKAGLVLLRYADAHAALCERTFKGPEGWQGAALDAATFAPGRARWGARRIRGGLERVPVDSRVWLGFFPALMDRTVPYLAGATGEQLNFEAGENVLLRLDPTARLSNFVDQRSRTRRPSSSPRLRRIPGGARAAHRGAVDDQGDDGRQCTASMGFSVNVPSSESRFAHLEKGDLDVIFGKDGYLLAEDATAHQEKEKLTRYGYEVFPWLMFLILIVHPGERAGQYVLQGSTRGKEGGRRCLNGRQRSFTWISQP